MPRIPQRLLPFFAALVIASFTPAALNAAAITFSGTVTAQDNRGPVIVTIGRTDFYAFLKVLDNGSATGSASGFTSVSGLLTLKFGNFALIDAGYGFENYGPGTGAFMNIYEGATLIGSASDMNFHLNIDRNGGATGYGWELLRNTGSAFYQEVLARNGGYLDVTFNSFTALTYNPFRDASTTGNFALSGTLSIPAAIPEPSTYAMLMAGTGLLVLMVRRRKTSSSERGAVNSIV